MRDLDRSFAWQSPALLAIFAAAKDVKAAGIARCPYCDDDKDTSPCECDGIAKWREQAFSKLVACVDAAGGAM